MTVVPKSLLIQPVRTGIFFIRSRAAADLGNLTVRTPSLKEASTLSDSTSQGSEKLVKLLLCFFRYGHKPILLSRRITRLTHWMAGLSTRSGVPKRRGRSEYGYKVFKLSSYALLTAILRGVAASTLGSLNRRTPSFISASIFPWSITWDRLNCL